MPLDPSFFAVPLPSGRLVRQPLVAPTVPDVAAAVRSQLARPEIRARLGGQGRRIAIGVGSRGLARLPQLVAAIVAEVKALGHHPFIVPAMGSHGGATAAGQREVLASYGVTEASVGAPIEASMDVVELGRLERWNVPVYFDRLALESDGVIVLNRVKPHTLFHGEVESGLTKMLAIGLGKQKGASVLHRLGPWTWPAPLIEATRLIISKAPILFGVATVENAVEDVALVEAVLPEALCERERELLEKARAWMGRLPFDEIDVLVVDQIGKDISGDGMDPNVTGRYLVPWVQGGPKVERIVVLGLTEATHGNASGLGVADVTTRRVVEAVDWDATYTNAITSAVLTGARVPVTVETDRQAVALAIHVCQRPEPERVRLVRIPNTRDVSRLWISSALWRDEAQALGLEALGPEGPLPFDPAGFLPPFPAH